MRIKKQLEEEEKALQEMSSENIVDARPATEPRDGPTRTFHEKYSLPKIWNHKKYPEKNSQNGDFWVFRGSLGGRFWESSVSGRGGIFSVFFVEIPGRAISGVCSRSGLSQSCTAIPAGPTPPVWTPSEPPPSICFGPDFHLIWNRSGAEMPPSQVGGLAL